MTPTARVRVPVTLRTDVAAACGDGAASHEALLDAVDRGVRRALDQARVRLPDGGVLALGRAGVTVRWSGPGCEAVPAPARDRLERALRARLAAAVAPARAGDPSGTWSPGARGWDERAAAGRWTAAGEYLIPSYDDAGALVPVAVDPAPPPPVSAFEDVLYPFTSYGEVLEAIQRFFPNPAPRGGRMYGVYGVWAATGYPTLFWLKELPAFIRTQSYVSVRTLDGKVIPSHLPIAYDAEHTYKLYVLAKPKQTHGVEYWLERSRLDGSRKQPAILNLLRDELRGWEIHFRVPLIRQESIFVEGKGTGEDLGIPPWRFFLVSWLGWQTDSGISADAWWWVGWLNLVPIEIRQDPIVKRIVEEWAVSKPSLNILFLYLHANEFYRAYCFHAALEMVAESRRNMEDFLKVISQPDHPWAAQFDTLVRHLSATGLQTMRMETGLASRYEFLLNTLRATLAYREGLFQQQEESVPPGRGGLPGGIIVPSELDELRAEIARVEAEQQGATGELEKSNAVLGAAATIQPLLVVLSIRNGQEVGNVAAALARYAPRTVQSDVEARVYGGSDAGRYWFDPARTDELPSSWVRREFPSLIQASLTAEQNMRDNPDKVYQIARVRQVVDRRLAPWLAANPVYQDSIKKMIEGPGILAWILIGLTLLALTIAFPPLGLTLSALVGGAQLASSVGQYRRFKVYSRVRLSQMGFVPLVSSSEVSGALLSVVLDTVFLFLDVKGLGSMARGAIVARRAERALGSARAVLDGFEEGMGRLLASVRHTDGWPQALTDRIRQSVEALAQRPGALAGRTVDEAVALAKAEMALRYERQLLDVKDELARLLQRDDLTGDELQRWLTERMRNPVTVLDELAGELKEGAALWEGVAGKLRTGAGTRKLTSGFDFLPAMSDDAAKALRTELGALADVLTPDRLLRLGLDLGVPYPELARRLNTLLARTPNAGRSLELLEDVCRGRPDAGDILRALETQARPLDVLEHLSPTLIGGVPGLGTQELFEAISRTSDAGTIVRVHVHTRVGGEVVLARDIVRTDGKVMVQRWAGPGQGWKVQQGWARRVEPTISDAARRAAEASTLATVAAGSERATRGLARLSQGSRRVLLEELEDTALDPALARRLLEDIEALPERSLDALVAIRNADEVAGGLGGRTWLDVFEHSQGWRDEMLRLVAEIGDVVDDGLAEAVRRGMSGATNIQGSLGHMHAAATLRRQFPGARMRFEVQGANREVDIVLQRNGRNVDVEVKTNLPADDLPIQSASTPSINTWQMEKDLRRHVADGGLDLLYLYHPSSAAQLANAKAAFIDVANRVLDPTAAAEFARRIDEIVQLYTIF